MLSEERYENFLFLVILHPDFLLTAPKVFKKPTLIIFWVSGNLELPFTVDYSYLQVNL